MTPLVPTNVHAPLVLDIGDTWKLQFDCNNFDGTDMDVSAGATLEWKLATDQPFPFPPEVVLTLTLGDGIELVAGSTNKVIVTLTSEQTAAIVAGFYRDQLRVTFPGPTIVRSTQSKGRIEAVASL